MFSDEFAGTKLDESRWMTRYLYGDKLLDKNYVQADDKHLFTDGKNVEFYNNKLRILTKPEKATGLVWDAAKGFYEREFEYTSGLVSTGKSFRQKYGRFEAKVKIGNSAVAQAFSLLAEQMIPHVDIFRFEGNKLKAGNFWKNGSNETISKSLSKTSGSRYTNDYYIYSLEWAPGKLTWKINGVVFKEQTQGVPDNEMYILFNSSLKQDASESGLPSALEVDWIRVYQLGTKE
jgi:beta-glucanase (GH16 family)